MLHEEGGSTRLAELMSALSLATDLGMGQPFEQAINSCLFATAAGREMRLPPADLSLVYYLALLRFVGCTADAHETALAVGGDDIRWRSGLAPIYMADLAESLRHTVRHYAEGRPGLRRLRLLAAFLGSGTKSFERSIRDHCEVARLLVTRVGLPPAIGDYVGISFERWDGKGLPGELAGADIPLPVRLTCIAEDVETFRRMGDWPFVETMLRKRRGKAYDPGLVDLFLDRAPGWASAWSPHAAWQAVVDAEPEPRMIVAPDRLEEILRAFADFADMKSPASAGHSRTVSALAGAAAEAMGLDEPEAQAVRRAGLVHDIGKVGIPNGILEKAGPLSHAEWERVRLHPYYTERILRHASALSGLAAIAGAHHERLDGSGYHGGLAGAALSRSARLLGVAAAFAELSEHGATTQDPASRDRQLDREVSEGRLDADAVSCVLVAAGRRTGPARHRRPAGLTEREVEVLRLICRGHSNAETARQLTISVKTVGRHVENIYGKIGASSRAAATLFAVENDLLES